MFCACRFSYVIAYTYVSEGASLALTYMGAITLIVTFSKAWERRLAVIFGAAGRLALTNYLLQFAVISVVAYGYGFGMKLTPKQGLIAAIILFAILAGFSGWWLRGFRFGPAEWFLRSLTYARFQPLRRPAVPVEGGIPM